MKQTKIFLCALALLSLAACEKKETQGRKVTVTISASIDQSPEAKANVDNSSGYMTWSNGDAIGVYTSDGRFTEFTLEDGFNGKSSGTFSADLDEGVSVVIPGVAVYPYHASDAFDPATKEVTYNLPDYYAWTQSWNNDAKPAMYAALDGGSVAFHHLGGIIRVQITNMARSATQFRLLTGGNRVTGAFTFNLNDAKPHLEAESISGSGEVAARFTMPANNSTSYNFNLPVPVGDYKNLEIRLSNSSDKSLYAFVSNKEADVRLVTAGTYLKMPALNVNIPLESFEDGFVSAFSSSNNYQGGNIYSIVDNPDKTGINKSGKVLKIQMAASGSGTSGAFALATGNANYVEGYRSNGTAFRYKVYFPSADDVAAYYLYAQFSNGTGGAAKKPDKIDGVVFDGTSDDWNSKMTAGVWHSVEYTVSGGTGALGTINFRPFANISNGTTTSGGRLLYFDDFELLK